MLHSDVDTDGIINCKGELSSWHRKRITTVRAYCFCDVPFVGWSFSSVSTPARW